MTHSVFVDKIGVVFEGEYQEANDNYETYKDFSQRGVGLFSSKSVYLLDGRAIVKSAGLGKYAEGGTVADARDFVGDFIIGKKLGNGDLSDDFSVLDSSVLIYKSAGGQYPLVSKKSKNEMIFHKNNFPVSDYIKSLEKKFKDICLKSGIKFEIK